MHSREPPSPLFRKSTPLTPLYLSTPSFSQRRVDEHSAKEGLEDDGRSKDSISLGTSKGDPNPRIRPLLHASPSELQHNNSARPGFSFANRFSKSLPSSYHITPHSVMGREEGVKAAEGDWEMRARCTRVARKA